MRPSRNILRWTLAAAAVVAVAAGTPALAHEGHHHSAMGTVRAIGATEIQLDTKEGTLEKFVLTDSTTYKRGNAAAQREGVKVGERAVVMYETKDGRNVAIEVKLAKSEQEGHGSHGE